MKTGHEMNFVGGMRWWNEMEWSEMKWNDIKWNNYEWNEREFFFGKYRASEVSDFRPVFSV